MANLLHPVYRGKCLDGDQKIDAQQKLEEINPDLLPELLAFSCDAVGLPETLTSQLVIEKTKPVVWWQCVEDSGKVSSELCEIARKLLKMPSSSASIKRIFS